jgi:hypothetical protein
MQNIKIDLNARGERIKYMNAVNNGPTYPSGGVRKTPNNFDLFKDAEISFARTHDTPFFSGYGNSDFMVDVHRIFRYFDMDENDPASYHLETTD